MSSSTAATTKITKKQPKFNNPEAHERINYLLHLCTNTLISAHSELLTNHPEKKYLTPAMVKEGLKDSIKMTQVYVKTLREVAQKSVIRLAPNTKRCLCKKCNCFLLPSITSKIRYTRWKTRDWTTIRCVQCGNVERFLQRPDEVVIKSTAIKVNDELKAPLVTEYPNSTDLIEKSIE